MKKLINFLLISTAISACTSAPVSTPALPRDGYTSICEINANKSQFLGKTVKLRTEYKSDRLTYTYLVDNACSTKNTISPGYFDAATTPGLADFLAEGARRCYRVGICPLTAHVDIEAVVVEDEEDIEFQVPELEA